MIMEALIALIIVLSFFYLFTVVSSNKNSEKFSITNEEDRTPTFDEMLDNLSPSVVPLCGNQYMSASEKHQHMNSEYINNLRNKRLFIANHCCEHCHSNHRLSFHHTHYRTLGCEDISDMRILCYNCHNRLHAHIGYTRELDYTIGLLKEI